MLHTKRSCRLEEEVRALNAGRHPGVIELVEVEGAELRSRHVQGRVLSEMGPLPPEEAAGLAAALAAILADLHGLGVVHGGVEASHVIVADDGRPVLCSLGRGGKPADDVAALGRLMTAVADDWAPDPLRARLQLSRLRPRRRRRRLGAMLSTSPATALAALAAEATAPDPNRRPDPRSLAAALRDRIPTARLPQPPPSDPAEVGSGDQAVRPPPPPWRRWAPAGACATIMVLALSGWAALGRQPGAGRTPRPVPAGPELTTNTPPLAARVWPVEPLHYEQGVLTYGGARYAVGQPGDAVVAGDWACRGRPTLVLLRPSTGQVFAFDSWAVDAEKVTARPVGQVEPGSSLRVVPAGAHGCQRLEILPPGGRPVRLNVGP